MSKQTQVRNSDDARYSVEGQEPNAPRPLSLSCGPALTWLYVLGNPEASAIVDAYRPLFKVRLATERETYAW